METLQAVLIEAFSDGPFGGNGAAVVALTRPMPDAWMQAVAASLRQSETAFLLHDEGRWLLRWFTPTCEVPLCGHATLAALLALAHWNRLGPGERTCLHSRSGPWRWPCPRTGLAGERSCSPRERSSPRSLQPFSSSFWVIGSVAKPKGSGPPPWATGWLFCPCMLPGQP